MFLNSLIFYVLALVSCIGAGYLLWDIVLRRLISDANVCMAPSSIESGIIGMFAIGMIAVLLNFFVSISQSLSMVLITFCFIAGLANLVKQPKSVDLKLLALIAVVVLFSFWGAKFVLRYDSALYHLQAISWIKDEPIVIGLANIHDRFGFNSLWLPALAVFWLPFYEVEGALLASHLPAIFFLFVLISHLFNSVKSSPQTLSISVTFSIFCLACVSTLPFLFLTSTTSTDLAPNVYTLLSVFIFLRGFENPRYPAAEITRDHLLLWIFAIFSILTKLSAITPCLLALIYTLYHKDVVGVTAIKRTLYFLIAVTGLWLLRNFLISGCLVYPVGLTCLDADLIQWSVGQDSADNARLMIERWAKAPGANFLVDGAKSQWLENWFQHPYRGGEITLIGRGVFIGILLSFLLVIILQKRSSIEQEISRRRPLTAALLVMVVALIGLLFGFSTAPDPRFWWGALLTLLILPASLVLFLFFRDRICIGKALVLSLVLLAAVSTGRYAFMTNPPVEAKAPPQKNHRASIPEIDAKLIVGDGFVMRMPTNDDRCWLAPKPCSPMSPEGLSQYHTGRYSVFTRKTEKTIQK